MQSRFQIRLRHAQPVDLLVQQRRARRRASDQRHFVHLDHGGSLTIEQSLAEPGQFPFQDRGPDQRQPLQAVAGPHRVEEPRQIPFGAQ